MTDYIDKPRGDTRRLLYAVADVMYCMGLAGDDQATIDRTVRGMVEAEMRLGSDRIAQAEARLKARRDARPSRSNRPDDVTLDLWRDGGS